MTSFPLLLVPFLLGLACASYDPYVDMAQLYRWQLLANAFDDYLPEDRPVDPRQLAEDDAFWPDLAEDPRRAEDSKGAIFNDALYSGAHLRDQEHLEHSALHGYQSVSGGTAEGAPNEKQVKSDKPLPAYCNPPNPCPVGKTAKDNCVENFDNSASNNKKLLSEQKCPCDTEHMFVCPAGSDTVSSKAQGTDQQATLNKVMDELAQIENSDPDQLENNPYLSSSKKRMQLVAKKSPRFIRKRSLETANPYVTGEHISKKSQSDYNPYLAPTQQRLKLVAKKSPYLARK